MEWLGFWIFMSTWIACEAWLYNKGHCGLLFLKHKTPEEKRLREAAIRKAENEAGINKEIV